MEQTPKQEWKVEKNTVYLLHQIGWRKGEPIMSNKFWAGVNGDQANGVTEDEIKEVAEMFASASSKDAEIKELVEALRLALPYVERAYECAFPDESENEYVKSEIEQLLSKYLKQ